MQILSLLLALGAAAEPTPALVAAGGELAANVYTGSSQQNPSLAVDADAGVFVVWAGRGAGDPNGIYGRRFDAQGGARGDEIAINGKVGNQVQSDPAIVRLAGGGFIAAWTSVGQDGDREGVFARRFAADGTASGEDFGLAARTAGSQALTDLAALPDGGFAAVWKSDDGSGSGTWLRRFAADGQPLGEEVLVNTATAHLQAGGAVAVSGKGDLVVTWHSAPTFSTLADLDGSRAGVFLQRFAASGERAGGETRVNTTVSGDQLWPDVAAQADGSFAVVWEGPEVDGQGIGVFAQVYGPDGTPRGVEQRLNQWAAGDQTKPRIAALAGGSYLVTWTSHWQDRDESAAVARVLAGDGAPQGDEWIVNQTAAGAQHQAVAAERPDGGAWVAWTSMQNPRNGNDVYLRAFLPRP
jgi:hypothetical protein